MIRTAHNLPLVFGDGACIPSLCLTLQLPSGGAALARYAAVHEFQAGLSMSLSMSLCFSMNLSMSMSTRISMKITRRTVGRLLPLVSCSAKYLHGARAAHARRAHGVGCPPQWLQNVSASLLRLCRTIYMIFIPMRLHTGQSGGVGKRLLWARACFFASRQAI